MFAKHEYDCRIYICSSADHHGQVREIADRCWIYFPANAGLNFSGSGASTRIEASDTVPGTELVPIVGVVPDPACASARATAIRPVGRIQVNPIDTMLAQGTPGDTGVKGDTGVRDTGVRSHSNMSESVEQSVNIA